MDSYTTSVLNKVYANKDTGSNKKRVSNYAKRKFLKSLTPEDKALLIKERFNLTHGGTKQNKKKRKKRRKNK